MRQASCSSKPLGFRKLVSSREAASSRADRGNLEGDTEMVFGCTTGEIPTEINKILSVLEQDESLKEPNVAMNKFEALLLPLLRGEKSIAESLGEILKLKAMLIYLVLRINPEFRSSECDITLSDEEQQAWWKLRDW